MQAQITASVLLPASGNIAQITTLTGYLELTDKTSATLASPANSACLAALPFSPPDSPKPPSAPTIAPTYITPATTSPNNTLTPTNAYNATYAPLFNAAVNPASLFGITTPDATPNDVPTSGAPLPVSAMGNCNFHTGILINGGCRPCDLYQVNCNDLTLDLVPANLEFCLDSSSVNRLVECDPNPADVATATPGQSPRAPIYAPLAGCASYYNDGSIQIDVNQPCAANLPVPRLQVYITHVIYPIGTLLLNGGDQIGKLCTRQDWQSSIPITQHTIAQLSCIGTTGSFNSNAPVHIAFQLRVLYGFSNSKPLFYWPFPQQYLSFLASPQCLYDRWQSSNSLGTPIAPQPQLFPTVQACP